MKTLKTFRLFLTTALAFQIAFATPLQLLAAGNDGNGDQDKALQGWQANFDPALAKKWDKASQAIEEGKIENLPAYDQDPFLLSRQAVEITGRGSFSLSDIQVNPPGVTFTGLEVKYNNDTKQLVFEGMRGQNAQGENGTVVARHIIGGIDVATLVRDEELLTIVDKSGGVHVIPMDYVAKNIFRSPLIVFKNIWKPRVPSTPFDSQNTRIFYATPGLMPPDFKNADVQAILPKDNTGNIKISAGDLFLYHDNKLVGVFSRQVTYEKIIRGFKSLLIMLMQVYPANVEASVAGKLAADLDKFPSQLADAGATQGPGEELPLGFRRALLQLSHGEVASIQGSIAQQSGRSSRQFHTLDEESWQKTYTELEAIAKQQGVPEDALENGALVNNWQSAYEKSAAMPASQKVSKREWIKNTASFTFEYLVPMFAAGALLGYPYAYEQFETWQQVQTLSWMYQALPDVVKDAEYRVPLLASTVSLIALWPMSVGFSWSIGKGLRVASAALSKSKSKVAQRIRDVARNWGHLNNWQRITSFGMRYFGTLIYPIARATIIGGLQQPTSISAWENGLNPFEKISPESALGKRMGLTQPLRVGVLPVMPKIILGGKFGIQISASDKVKAQRELQMKAQGYLADRKRHLESLAWQIAALAVAEKENIDPATLELTASGQLDPALLGNIMRDQNLTRQWDSAQQEIYTYLKGFEDGRFDQDLKEVSHHDIAEHYAFALEVAKKIKARSGNQAFLANLMIKSKRMLRTAADKALNWGLEDSRFLRTVFTNEYVSDQTRKSFVADHLMVVMIYAFIGDRADLNHPEHLAANKNGILWTSGPHWSDTVMNTYSHYFVGGSKKALIYQTIKPIDSKLYEPAEYQWGNQIERREGFFATAYQWVKNVVDPRVSDIGNFALQGFKKRFTTIQAAIAMNIVTRMYLGSQSVGDALLGWSLFFFAAQWYYGWPWDIIDRGSNYEGVRMAEMRAGLDQSLANVSQGLRNSNENAGMTQVREGVRQMFGLYAKHNPDAFSGVAKLLQKNGMNDLVQEYKTMANSDNIQLMGLLAEISAGLQAKDQTRVDRAAAALKEAYRSGGAMSPEIERMSAQALLDFSTTEAPIFSNPHPGPSWVAVALLGAVLTTVLAIPLSVKSFDPDFISLKNIGFWAVANTVGYFLYYKSLSKDGWVAKVLNKLDTWKAQRTLTAPSEGMRQAAQWKGVCDRLLKAL